MRVAPGLLLLGPALLLAVAGCDTQRTRVATAHPPAGITQNGIDTGATLAGVQPGIHPSVIYGDLSNPYQGNPEAIREGRHLFVWYNCSGCHGGRAGGGMGPSLRDSLWTYGDSDTQIFSTIMEGRSAGMPAWGRRLPEDQAWKIISYIRTLNTPAEPDKIRNVDAK